MSAQENQVAPNFDTNGVAPVRFDAPAAAGTPYQWMRPTDVNSDLFVGREYEALVATLDDGPTSWFIVSCATPTPFRFVHFRIVRHRRVPQTTRAAG